MKVKFYPERKSSKTGECALWCYVREYKETLYLNTGQKINPAFWDNDMQRANLRLTRNNVIKGSLKSLNQYLNAFESKIFDIERILRGKQPDAGFNTIADAIKRQFDKKKVGLFDIYDEFISIKRKQITTNSISKHERTKKLLLDYEKDSRERFDFDKITPLFFEKFKIFMMDKTNLIDNTVSKHLILFKTFLIWANTNGYTNNLSYKSIKAKFEDNEVIFITKDEMDTLYNLKLDNERLERVRDVFVFQCLSGQRYSDIENISREDIKGNDIEGYAWHLRTQKTHQILEIPLEYYAPAILAKYIDYPQPLPVISNQKMNKYLKELCEKAGINEPIKIIKYKSGNRIESIKPKFETIGTHTARRTCVSVLSELGVPADVIMSITGHTTYRMMQKYLKVTYKHKREALRKAYDRSSNLKIVKAG